MTYVLRTCPPDHIKTALSAFDDNLRQALSDLAGSPLSDWSWLKASLPPSLGGLSLRRASLHAPAAYIGSFHQSKPLISKILGHPPKQPSHLPSTLSALAKAAARPEWCSINEIDIPLFQHCLSHAVDETSFSTLLDTSPDTRSKALALSSAIQHAGDWLNVVPSAALGLHLQDREFRLCLQYWLGLWMSEDGTKCPVCYANADPFGDHQVGCGGNGDRIYQHDSLRDALFSAAQSAALAPRRELPSLIPDSHSHPADIFLPSWKGGRPAALDVTVISTLQQLTLPGAATVQGHALLLGEERKLSAHAEACRSVGVSFIPLVMESLGGWNDEAADTISSIGRLMGQRLGISPAESTHHLFQRCVISLWRGNSALWICRCSIRAPSLDGVL